MIKKAFTVVLAGTLYSTLPLAAQAPATPEKAAQADTSALNLSLDAFTDMKNIFKIAGTANNLENANKAVVAIKGLTATFPAQIKAIDVAKAPLEADRRKWAITMLDAQQEVQDAVKTMNATLNAADKEVQELMAPVMQSFFLNVAPLTKAIEKHFPDDERAKFEQEEKERRNPKKAKPNAQPDTKPNVKPDTKEDKVEADGRSTNEVAMAFIKDLQAAYLVVANATDKASALAASEKVNTLVEKFAAHETALKAVKMPTDAERKAMAVENVNHQTSMQGLNAKLGRLLFGEDEELKTITRGTLDTIHNKSGACVKKLNVLYPEDVMKPLRQAEVKRRAEAEKNKK